MIILNRSKTVSHVTPGAIPLAKPSHTPGPPPVVAPGVVTKIQNFFANPFMCDWSGCNDLHAAYQKEVDALTATHCPPCRLGALKTKYAQLIRNALATTK